VKGLEGTERVFTEVRPAATRPDSILEHDESVFFSVFAILTLLLWIYDLVAKPSEKNETH